MEIQRIGVDQLDAFLKVATVLHGGDPLWVASMETPLRSELRAQEASASNTRQALFLCLADGQAVGRIGAWVDSRLTDEDHCPVGQVGYFECMDSQDAGAALLDAANEWLAQQKVKRVWGPMAGGAHRPHRFMTAGFDRTPFLFEPRNPAYYPELFERYGFHRIHSWNSFDLSVDSLEHILLEQMGIMRAASRAKKRYRIKVPDGADPATILGQLHPLLSRMWHGHVGYISLDFREFCEAFGGVLALLPQGYLGVLETGDGNDVGMAMMYPDLIANVRNLQGDVSRWGQWRDEKLPPRIILHTTALTPQARGRGAIAMFLEAALRRIQEDQYTDAIIALVDQESGLRFAGMRPTRTYALYGRFL